MSTPTPLDGRMDPQGANITPYLDVHWYRWSPGKRESERLIPGRGSRRWYFLLFCTGGDSEGNCVGMHGASGVVLGSELECS